MPHPFDRYAEVTNIELLKEFSSNPLRKCLRINTLKQSVDSFLQCVKTKNWTLDPVPWCSEGFFIDREDRSEALGKDVLQLLGHFYMQEASSMLPVTLLGPQPGEMVLDMSAAPGSKTTQIGALMQQQGVIVANDIQPKRLQTLKEAVERAGLINAVISKKPGQWFGKHMIEQFDRVLCDAPCTAQGTVRKDSDALKYFNEQNIYSIAKIQYQLLESAIHSCKVGGKIVYSTCTLTVEENEELVSKMLERFEGKIEAVPPSCTGLQEALNASENVQKKILRPMSHVPFPAVRLWPHTYNTEGFFCAALQKTDSTCRRQRFDRVRLPADPISKREQREIEQHMKRQFGISMLEENEVLWQQNGKLILTNETASNTPLPFHAQQFGLSCGKRSSKLPYGPDHAFATLRGSKATQNIVSVSEDDIDLLLKGQNCSCNPSIDGFVFIEHKGLCIGKGKAKHGVLKNQLPRHVIHTSMR